MSASMNKIISLYVAQCIEQLDESSQSVPMEEAENVENVNVSEAFRELLKISFELKTDKCATTSEKKDLIDTTESKMEVLFQNIITSEAKEKDAMIDDIIALAITHYNMGRMYLDANLQKLLVISEAHFTKCMILLKGKELKGKERKVIITMIRVLLDLEMVFCELGQSEEGYSLAETAMELYLKYTKEEIEYPDPINIVAILGISDKDLQSKVILETLKLKALLRMFFYYEKNFHDKHKYVLYIHNILDQLRETISRTLPTYCVDWAITSSHLSQYFVYNYRFTEARNHLIAAEYMMKMFHEKVIETVNEEDCPEYKSFDEQHKTGYNSVIKCWGLYGTELLVASASELFQRKDDDRSCEKDNSESESESVVKPKEDLTKLLMFTDVEKNFENFDARFPDKSVSNLNEAKLIFVNVLKCFDRIKKYFDIKDHLVDVLNITIATSKLYKCLAAFESGEDKLNLHIRRIELLGNFTEEGEKQCYTDSHTLILLKGMIKILIEMIAANLAGLDIKIDFSQLDIEHLNTIFTIQITMIKEIIMNVIQLFQSAENALNFLID